MPGSTVIPCLRYRDAPAAIKWLCEAFGFEEHLVVPGPNGTIAHAQLSRDGGMIMLGSGVESEWTKFIRQPDQIGAAETQAPFVFARDVDAVYARVKRLGGEMLIDIKDEDYGARGFTCRDPQGHIWSVGDYDAWATR